MRRWIGRMMVGGSVALLVAVVGLWVRSERVRDYAWAWVSWPGGGGRSLKVDADSGGGQVELSWKLWEGDQREAVKRQNELAGRSWYHRVFPQVPQAYSRSQPPTIWNALGFRTYHGATHSSVYLPYWAGAAIFAVVPAAWGARRFRRRVRIQRGLCAVCGYDLRASGGRCPECGRERVG